MSAIPFPRIWIPRRDLWHPPLELFTAGKGQRKSDGKMPRKTSSGTTGKVPRNTGAASNCCCGTPSTCSCPSGGGDYRSTLLVTFDSGISIPFSTCISPDLGTTNEFDFSSMPIASASFCCTTQGTLSPANCTFAYPANGSDDDTTTGLYGTHACGGAANAESGIGISIVDPANTHSGSGLGVTATRIGGHTIKLFLASGFVVPCGGSVTVSNTAQYRNVPGSTFSNFGGNATITDTSC